MLRAYCSNIYTVFLGSSGVQAVAALIYKACQRQNKMEANIQSFTQIAKVCGELFRLQKYFFLPYWFFLKCDELALAFLRIEIFPPSSHSIDTKS